MKIIVKKMKPMSFKWIFFKNGGSDKITNERKIETIVRMHKK